MNFGDMQQLFWQRIDQSGSPDFTPAETDRLLNWAYDIWYIMNRRKFNLDQTQTVNMTFLLRPFSFPNKSVITVSQAGCDLPNYRDLATMTATFNKVDCNNNTVQITPNVRPMPLSSVDVNKADPFNSPTNEYPFYSQSHNGTFSVINVESTTTPLALTGTYFKKLQVIDATNSPNTDFEAQDYIARQVIDIAKILAKGDVDDYPSVKNAINETGMTLGGM